MPLFILAPMCECTTIRTGSFVLKAKLILLVFVHHSIIHKENPTRCNSVPNFISYLYKAQHVSGDTPPIIRSLKLHQQPLVWHKWRVFGRVVAASCQRAATTRPTTLHLCKTRGCQCSFRLLMMGGVSPETCCASYKYEIKF